MLKTVIAAMLKHKQVVFAVVAVAALSGLVIAPATQNVRAATDPFGIVDETLGDLGIRDNGGDDDDDDETDIEGDDNQAIDQAIDQENDQEQEADQDVTQTSSQDETNIQANELDTGDNTATVAQSNDAEQDVAAAASADDNDVSAKASAEDDDHHKHKKHHSSDSDSASAEADADAIIKSTAEATGIVDQSNTADVDQDSSIHDVDLSNNVAFGDDTNTQVAVPIIDQDQRAANLAANLAANIDEEYGFQTGGGGGGGGGGDNDGVIRCFQENQGFGPVRECIRDL
jgi:hypothetical protein